MHTAGFLIVCALLVFIIHVIVTFETVQYFLGVRKSWSFFEKIISIYRNEMFLFLTLYCGNTENHFIFAERGERTEFGTCRIVSTAG